MTEPVPGQTPEPVATDDVTAMPPKAGPPAGQPTQTPEPAEAEPAEAASPEAGSTEAASAETGSAGTPPSDLPSDPAAANPQELFGSLSLAAIEADIDRLMDDKMSQLDGMLAGLEELVQRLEGEITHLEPPADDAPGP